MTLLFTIALHNVVIATFLALLVWGVTRVWKNPPIAHVLWLLVLAKLLTPPLVNLDLWKWETATTETKRSPDLSVSTPQPNVEDSRFPTFESSEMSESIVESNRSGDLRRSVASRGDAISDQPRFTAVAAWNAIRPILIAIWFGGAVVVAWLTARRIVHFHFLLAGTLPASERLQSVVKELVTKMGLKHVPDVRVVDCSMAPLVWCIGRRAKIVLPLRLLDALDEHQTAMVLAHELAHLRRYDHWVRIVELIVSVVYWWNPLVWWVRGELHAVEEQCCDAWVSWLYPDQNRDYAESLITAVELLSTHSKAPALASPFLNVSTLKERIVLVLKGRSQRTASRWAAVWLTLLAAVVIPVGVLTVSAEGRALTDNGQAQAPSPNQQETSSESQVNRPSEQNERPSDGTTVPESSLYQAVLNDKPISKEAQPFQGSWNVESFDSLKWPVQLDEAQTWQWKIHGQKITWTRPGQKNVTLSFTVEPGFTRSSQKRWNDIDITFLDGPDQGQTCLGSFFWFDTEVLWICFQDPGAKAVRPRGMGFNGYDRHTVIALRPTNPATEAKADRERSTVRPTRVPVAGNPMPNELQVFQGTWNFGLFDSVLWYTPLDVIRKTWTWKIEGQQITWTRAGHEPVKLSFTVDPSKTPNQIDFTFLDGSDKGQKCQGIYEFERGHVWLCMTEPGANVERPKQMAMSSDSHTALIIMEDKNQDRSPVVKPVADTSPHPVKVEDPKAEIDAAIARLRDLGAFVREFHPRGDPRYWVQIIPTGVGAATRQTAENFGDAAMNDVEIIGRGATLHLHLRHTSVTNVGLTRLASAGRIEMLELTGPNITFGMLKVLPTLPLEGHLGLHSDQLTNAGIKPVTECQQLTGISLSGNQLGNACLEYLTHLPKLQSVSLGKQFTREAFAVLGRLENLTSLEVSELNPELSDLKQVPKLRRLSLSGKVYNDETALTIADTFKSLEEAYLRHTSITNTGVQYLTRLETLTILTLDDSLVNDGMADSIRKMKQLKWLSVENCAIGDDTVAAVSECPDLWYLMLINTPVTDKGIAHLTKLKKPLNLYLAHCKSITDASIESLAKLPDSENQHLALWGSGITEDGFNRLRNALPHAQIRWAKR